MKAESIDIEQMIYDETQKRLELMENPDYTFPTKLKKADVAGIIIMELASIILIIMCMAEVII